MNDLVTLTSQRLDAKIYTTGDVIAKYAGITHHAVNKTIREQLVRLKRARNGLVEFKMQRRPSGRMAKVYLLNEQQATLLITFLKNTPRVADFKEELVRQFTVMKRELILRQAKFELGKEFSKSLHAAIRESPALGEHGHLYVNINKLVYKQALGVNVNELRKARNIPKTETITHYLSSSEADAVKRVKQQIRTLLEMKLDYQQIKQALQIQGVIYRIELQLPAKASVK
ncbi:prophage P3 protein 3, phage-like repressor,C-term domain [Lactiplantibacillus plantarum]|uniref:Rha family transcriptional regulator n=1 Tax=Lactiplantibacillus plantarum TaxID=1590 RepID=UPI0005FAB59C|nr:Rha family transcriptional regulator [Lactiplantibacillus plantarum]MCG0572715.1 phage regulatory protein [Lactiplantibacillus plantarum]MCG0783032.1 phage regulatory protein [Lactiplantibacillus plantarum]UTD40550.1 Rha family transcriptional regulator [Lactiplantibacillus plantarum]VDH10589.1 prophage P3 protein 3, phage-like repressor,C-term domain [Lactiplantibacillus plantarum]